MGLPLALVLANSGLKTLIHDRNQAAMDSVKAGNVPYIEEGGQEALDRALASGRLFFSQDPSHIANVDVLIVTIGTPVDEFLNPVYDAMSECMDAFKPYLSEKQLVILRSTVPPGVTDWLGRYLADQGVKPLIAFCPERVVQGKAIQEIQSLPQIVSGTTPEAEDRAAEFFGRIADEVVRMKPMEAEFAKLFCNASRYIEFAISNQFFMMVSSVGLDYSKVLQGMKQNYSRMAGFPGAGFAAGPCLFKDTLQLCSFYDNHFSLGYNAMMVNEGLPLFVVRALEQQHDLKDKTIGLLGMAFKPNSDDTRSSLSYKLKTVLHPRAKATLGTDPFVVDDEELLPLEEVVEKSDILILCVPHSPYKTMDFGGKPVVDIWDFLPATANVIRLGNQP